MRLVLPSAIVAVTRYAPALASGVVIVMRLSKCRSRGERSTSPGRDLLADVLLFPLFDEPIADVADVDFLPIQLLLARTLQVSLHVVEQALDVDLLGLEAHLVAVAERKLQRRALPGGLDHVGLKTAQIAEDLLQPLLLEIVLAGAVFLDAPLPMLRGLGILAAVLEDLGQRPECRFAVPRLRVVGHSLIELDKVEFIGKLEALDAGGQPSNGFVFA